MKEYWLALQNVYGIGPILARRLVERFGDPAAAFAAGPDALARVEGIGTTLARRLAAGPDLTAAREEVARCEELGFDLIPVTDPRYPVLLRQVPDAPLVLYVAGTLAEADRRAVAVVGSRDASPYGIRMATYLAGELARAGVTVVSGFAQGIDAAAHRGALQAGGRTIAVMGCGLDRNYPEKHRHLRAQVAQSGALLSEFPLGTEPLAENFPRRNRLISGLSLGVVVVEAGMKSGSLITARLALEQGREVFAVPGPADTWRSRGCHWLIKQGARLVDSPGDVLAEIIPGLQAADKPAEAPAAPPAGLGEEERRVLMLCGTEPIHIDQIARASGIPVGSLSAVLLTLELQNLVEQLPGTHFRRKVGT